MKCSKCNGKTYVKDSVLTKDNEIYRRRKCSECGHMFYTAEYPVFPNDDFMKEWNSSSRHHKKTNRVNNRWTLDTKKKFLKYYDEWGATQTSYQYGISVDYTRELAYKFRKDVNKKDKE